MRERERDQRKQREREKNQHEPSTHVRFLQLLAGDQEFAVPFLHTALLHHLLDHLHTFGASHHIRPLSVSRLLQVRGDVIFIIIRLLVGLS